MRGRQSDTAPYLSYLSQRYAAARNNATGTSRLTATDLRNRLIRSISCMVCAVNHDSPQCGQEII